MSLRIIEISAPDKASDKIKKLAEQYDAIDCWHSNRSSWFNKSDDKRETTRILIDVQNQQQLIDALTRSVQNNDSWRIILLPVEATLPKPKQEENVKPVGNSLNPSTWINIRTLIQGSITREELQTEMEQGSRLNFDFLMLVLLSSIVAGIGLIQSDVAIIIGAMVIAPLLGPNLALAFGAALGDKSMISNAVKTNFVGLGFTLLISAAAGHFIPEANIESSTELMNRTNVNYASMFLALAAGGAAVLSLTTGVSSALVGVMVAVALMPPAVALGITIGNQKWDLAYGTTLLLATNVVCINLAAVAVFRLKGIKPRTWFEEKNAKKATRINALIWLALLAFLAVLIWFKKDYLD